MQYILNKYTSASKLKLDFVCLAWSVCAVFNISQAFRHFNHWNGWSNRKSAHRWANFFRGIFL